MMATSSQASPAIVQKELARVIQSRGFSSSPRLRRLLSYIVERTLDGSSEALKEYTLATEVFERPASFDPRLDPIVRVQASNLRSKLKGYYAAEGRDAELLIDLPKGTYVCRFIVQSKRESQLFTPKSKPANADYVAVLACADLSPAHDQEHLCDGITEELISALASVKALRVVGRTSVFQFKRRLIDVRVIGERLGVDSVLETSCRLDGNQVRVTAHLTEVSSGFTIWSKVFTSKLQQIFAVQEQIAQSIAKALCGDKASESVRRLAIWPSGDVDSYNLYLRARYHLNKRDETNIRKGLLILEELQNRESANAHVCTALAECHLLLALAGAAPPKLAMKTAEQHARRALSFDNKLADAHTLLAALKALFDWDWPAADREFQQAFGLDPDSVLNRIGYATTYLLPMGRTHEAVEQLREAVRLDPLSLAANQSLVWALCACRRFDEAVQKCTLLIDMDPSLARAHALMGVAYVMTGLRREGMRSVAKVLRLSQNQFSLPNWATAISVYSIAGARHLASRALEALESKVSKGTTSSYWLAVANANLGNVDVAMRLLKQAVVLKDPWVPAAVYDPLAEPLRAHRQFGAAVREIGLGRV
jgi:TolB-like protein/Flp pilus assembly protein TadD